jgi:heterodisulfide reductase subunit A
MTLSEVERLEGEAGNFKVTVRKHPRYVDMDKCIACGQCTQKCPKKVKDAYNGSIGFRKAVFIRYPQAVPLKYRIDPDNCLKLTKGKCGVCEKVCPTGAIRFDDKEQEVVVGVGSIILAPGFKPFDPSGIRTWGYGLLPNVITAVELERYLSASGPTEGRLIRPSDGEDAKKIAFLQCVGSRDLNKNAHGYCSSVCCMFAIKEAMLAMSHVKDLDVSMFFMDVRTCGKGFERYFKRAEESGVKFRRCRVHSLEPSGQNEGSIYFRYITDEGKQIEEEFDLVILSTGIESRPEAVEVAGRMGVELNSNGFVARSTFAPVSTTKPGIYTCGCFAGPMDIPQSVIEASAAAAAAMLPLADVRHSLTKQKEFPPERDVTGKEPRIGVFVCHCGSNIAGVIDVEDLADYVTDLPHVMHVERNLFTCSQDTQDIIRQRIQEHDLNRIVVAACTPRSHEGLFRETLKASGLNENLFEMANIRNHASWVHAGEPEAATQKAKDMVRMAVAKAGLLEPLPPVSVTVNPRALVVGGGVAGMAAALGMADQGFPVHLVEKSSQLGGTARHLVETWKRESIPPFVEQLIARVREHSLISIHLNSEVCDAEGFVGNFRSTIRKDGNGIVGTVDHGVAIIATGGQAFKPVDEYEYGCSRSVFTALEFDKLHQVGDERIRKGRSFVFIQCVGSREPGRMYCSRVCCTHSVLAAVALKEEAPDRNVYILYRDIRTYGQREDLFKRARELGVVFIRYNLGEKPEIRPNYNKLEVFVKDHVLNEMLVIPADVVTLATAIVAPPDVEKLAQLYKLPLDEDKFFLEAHAKLRPVDFANEGVFLAGLAQYPKPMEETISQSQAVVSRATTVLSRRSIALDSIKSHVSPERCDGCALCLDVCPYHAITLEEAVGADGGKKQLVRVNMAKCKGCGICQATCPKEGINVAGFSYRQLAAQIEAALQ